MPGVRGKTRANKVDKSLCCHGRDRWYKINTYLKYMVCQNRNFIWIK